MTDRMMYGCAMARTPGRLRPRLGLLAVVQLSGVLGLASPAVAAEEPAPPDSPLLEVKEVHVDGAGAGRRLVIELSRAPERVTDFMLDRPPRLVLDAAGPVAVGGCLARFPVSDADVAGVRAAPRGGRLRVVVDLESDDARPVFHQEEMRLVVDLGEAGAAAPPRTAGEPDGMLASTIAVDPPAATETAPVPAEETAAAKPPAATGDPDRFNKANLRFNQWLLSHALEPVARAYNVVMPKWGQRRVVDFMANVESPRDAINSVLQLKMKRAGIHTGRFLVNTTAGLAGFFDVAGPYLHLEANPETFDETFGVWRLPPGNYLVLPVIGEFSTRSLVGWVGDGFLNPLSYIPGAPLLAATGAAYVLRNVNLLAQGMPYVCAPAGEWDAYKQSRFQFQPYEPGRALFFKDQAERVAE